MTKVIGILCADLHLSHSPPIARSCEDWYGVMERQLKELRQLARRYDCPILCAGDVLHRWNEPAELINFLIDVMPKMYSVAGNHDLRHGNYDDIHKTAYWTLVEAKTIVNIHPDKSVWAESRNQLIPLYGFPHGFPVILHSSVYDNEFNIAVIHSYVWEEGKGHPGALESQRIGAYADRLKGYDVALFGDNHKTVLGKAGDCQVFNSGGFFRRNIDEQSHRPCVGLLHADKTITKHFLDVSKDKFIESDNETVGLDASGFIEELSALNDETIDFRASILRVLEKASKEVREIVLEAMDK